MWVRWDSRLAATELHWDPWPNCWVCRVVDPPPTLPNIGRIIAIEYPMLGLHYMLSAAELTY
ncbi:hypothetical protein TIFTF001_019053 [Ficus carica]|uniref:Uncharacterized protein n=1 Tax=Ficus carica TaxID=3494 RepID=A0AA88AFB2_FICCA|nr:hypothetical protein TIFTF001_019053 [Ficus carica]